MANKTKSILEKYESKRENLLPILHEINDTDGYISKESMQEIALFLDISPAEVYGTTTFYSFFNIEKKGKYIIRLCRNISCHLAGKEDIAWTLEKELGIKFGETTEDYNFTLEYTNCIGMCDSGPAMLINNDVHTLLTPSKVRHIINGLKSNI